MQSVCGSLPSARNRSRQDIPSRRAVRRAVVPVCCRKSRVTLQALEGTLYGLSLLRWKYVHDISRKFLKTFLHKFI